MLNRWKESRNIIDAGETWSVRDFTLAEYADNARDFEPHPANRNHPEVERYTVNGSRNWPGEWIGCPTLDDARALTTWPEGRERFARLGLSIDDASLPRVASRRRRRFWGEDGEEFDRERFDAGDFDHCWQGRRREARLTPVGVVRITCQVGGHCKRAADALVWSGLAACLLIDRLESAGYRVEVEAVFSTKRAGYQKSRYSIADVVSIKAAHEPLNLDGLLMALAHPASLRFWGFCNRLQRSSRIDNGLGITADVPAPLRGDIHVAKVFTAADAARTVREALARFAE